MCFLHFDCCIYFQFVVSARDDTNAARSSSASVTVSVVRNPNGPYFPMDDYKVTISEYAPLKMLVTRLEAIDDDPKDSLGGILNYRFGNADPLLADDYFEIHDKKGEIYVQSYLTVDELPDVVTVSTLPLYIIT